MKKQAENITACRTTRNLALINWFDCKIYMMTKTPIVS